MQNGYGKKTTKKKTAAKKDKLKPLKKGLLGRTQKRRMGRAADIAKSIKR